MKYRYVVLIGLINFILMSTIFQIFRINDALPNLCIILSIVFVALFSDKHAYIYALTCGALQDVFLGKILGINLLLYVLIVYVVIRLERVMFKGNFLTPFFLIAFATVLYHILFYIMMFFLQSTIPLSLLIVKIVTEIVYNSVLGLFFYSVIFKKLNGYKLGDFNA
ncbi:rod shape-determining protein MreD [Fusibacter ferrireducens]|uniref:Rod shape-determining protein MreD n=1 Tax=Fusibacter ferrireducens TaxID=2785058 RepID=A0ABR9ZWM1_9FIRM|nr:rod shape-determining protein MreD [Fusibacter ferrireducens]MBF4694867.1 rod shape-determining protein MreD [Fusibacter ferrireducens]